MELSSISNQYQSLKIDYENIKELLEKEQERARLYQEQSRLHEERTRFYDEENSRLHEIIRKLKREVFGSKKERWIDKQQFHLFNEAEAEAVKDKPESNEEKTTVGPHTRTRGKRKPLPENLPREVVVIDIPDSEKVASDGSPLRVIGKEVSEKLVFEPATTKVIEYHRLKYGGIEGDDTVKVAPAVPSIVPKSICTPSLLAHIVTAKFADGLPLYRQEEQFERLGITLPRSSMGRWIVKAAETCQGIYNALEERLLSSFYTSCDETKVQVLKEEGRAAEAKSWMWVRSTPGEQNKVVLFDCDPSRSGEVVKRLFCEFEGYFQADGYDGYNGFFKEKPFVTRLGCNMHARRRFFDAEQSGSKKGGTLAQDGLRFYKRLYDIEEEAKALLPHERFLHRKERALPIWEEMKIWAETHHAQVPPKSKIGEAFHYFIAEYEYLKSYLYDGRLEMDNGFAERAIKNFAIGRKNWLFSDTVQGANASGLFYSLVVTAKVNSVDPYQALYRIFDDVPTAATPDDYERLANILLGLN
jgi:transposase